MRIAVERDARHGDAPAFIHVEDDAHPCRVGFEHVDDLHLSEVIALRAVQGVDAPASAGDGGGVHRPALGHLGLVAHAALGQAAHAAHGPLEEDGALVQPHHEDLAPPGGVLRHAHVVELAHGVQGLDGTLHVAVTQRPAGREGALIEHLLTLDPAQPEDDD